jgi:hypothetical protein
LTKFDHSFGGKMKRDRIGEPRHTISTCAFCNPISLARKPGPIIFKPRRVYLAHIAVAGDGVKLNRR